MSLSAISVKNLKKAYESGKFVLEVPQLNFQAGELTCILGPTGCGKSTLLNILAGIDADFQGEVSYTGAPHHRVSYQPQKDLLLPWKTVRENLLLGFSIAGEALPANMAADFLRFLDLESVADAYPNTLSVGMRQRVALGRALIWSGDLKLLDEPLSAQDFSRRTALETLLRLELRKPDSVAVVVTHNLDEAVVLADRIIVLGGQPAKVLDDFKIVGLPEVNRPIEARRSPLFAQFVARTAQALSGIAKLP